MILYVIDASVAARFLLSEDLSDEAGRVLERFMNGFIDLAAPELTIYEIGNTLWKAFKQGSITMPEAEEKLSQFLDLRINFIKLNRDDYEKIIEWSAENNMTYYDGAYVITSEKVRGIFLTADDILYEKASKGIPTLHLRDSNALG
ncbi:MAG: type II toxin-antitoxin system VapC family toxin [Candidatus Bathyarchaeia archaeon]